MRILIGPFLVACLAVLSGCSEVKPVETSTQVTLRVQVQDPALLKSMTHLRISLLRKDDAWVPASAATVATEDTRWPLDIPIVPRSSEAVAKPFEVIVDALEGEARLAQTRVVTAYAQSSLRVLELWLYACPGKKKGFVCAEDDCHGEGCQVCSVTGSCDPVRVSDPERLPMYSATKVPSVKAPPGWNERDAGAGLLDGSAGGAATDPEACSPTCPANAECIVSGSSATCKCLSGYEDQDGACEDIDECREDNAGCPVSAICENTPGGHSCSCKPGFDDSRGDGTACADKCQSAGCDPHATCTIVGTEAVCACTPPYVGQDGKSCAFDESCSLLDCDPHASCEITGSAVRECKCKVGYTGSGTQCSNVNECTQTPGPCGANSTCQDTDGAYTCTCASGYRDTGSGCELIDGNDCASKPCMNGGTCNDLVNDFSCRCPAGFDGERCEHNIDDCAPNPCRNGGRCTDGANTVSCSCAAGFSGSRCETNVNDCSPNPCQNGGTCTDLADDFRCSCPVGFSGSRCEARSCGNGTVDVGEQCDWASSASAKWTCNDRCETATLYTGCPSMPCSGAGMACSAGSCSFVPCSSASDCPAPVGANIVCQFQTCSVRCTRLSDCPPGTFCEAMGSCVGVAGGICIDSPLDCPAGSTCSSGNCFAR